MILKARGPGKFCSSRTAGIKVCKIDKIFGKSAIWWDIAQFFGPCRGLTHPEGCIRLSRAYHMARRAGRIFVLLGSLLLLECCYSLTIQGGRGGLCFFENCLVVTLSGILFILLDFLFCLVYWGLLCFWVTSMFCCYIMKRQKHKHLKFCGWLRMEQSNLFIWRGFFKCKAWINWSVFYGCYISEGYHYRQCDLVAQKDHFVVFNFRHGIRLAKWSSSSWWVCGASGIFAHNMWMQVVPMLCFLQSWRTFDLQKRVWHKTSRPMACSLHEHNDQIGHCHFVVCGPPLS